VINSSLSFVHQYTMSCIGLFALIGVAFLPLARSYPKNKWAIHLVAVLSLAGLPLLTAWAVRTGANGDSISAAVTLVFLLGSCLILPCLYAICVAMTWEWLTRPLIKKPKGH
jgi:cellobiose-specific phosphotransferase system component IIC